MFLSAFFKYYIYKNSSDCDGIKDPNIRYVIMCNIQISFQIPVFDKQKYKITANFRTLRLPRFVGAVSYTTK